jgi:hypothetical protein
VPVTPLSPPAASQDQAAGLAAAWLRVNCPCDRCQDPGSGQRLASPADLPAEVRVTAVPGPDGDLRVTFWPDGHQAVFRRSWPAAQAAPAVDERTEDAKRLWTAADFPAGPPAWPWPDYQPRDAARAEGLAAAGRRDAAARRPRRAGDRAAEPGVRAGDQLRAAV